MPTIRRVQAWYTETVEITWSRPKVLADPTSETETLTVRYTAPPTSTWEARTDQRWRCPYCSALGFEPSITGKGCTFCDGTEGGRPPVPDGQGGYKLAD